MKMSNAQYITLLGEVEKFEKAYGESVIREFRHNVKFAKVQFNSFVWAMLWKIKSDTRAIITDGLYDTHIETGLKKAWAKYA